VEGGGRKEEEEEKAESAGQERRVGLKSRRSRWGWWGRGTGSPRGGGCFEEA